MEFNARRQRQPQAARRVSAADSREILEHLAEVALEAR